MSSPAQPSERRSGGAPVTAVLRTADVLSYLAQAPTRTVGVTEVAKALGLSKAVVFRILVSLYDRGYVDMEEQTRRYLLGPKSLALGMSYLERTDVRQLARTALIGLSAQTGETATLSVRTGWERMYVDQVTPDDDIKMVVPIGRPFPLHAGSSSKTFLAFLPADEQEHYLRDGALRALTPATITDVERLRHELVEIRRRGWAASQGERQSGAGSVAAPLLDRDGVPVAVISVCGPIERFRARSEEAARQLVAETQALSRRLGYRG